MSSSIKVKEQNAAVSKKHHQYGMSWDKLNKQEAAPWGADVAHPRAQSLKDSPPVCSSGAGRHSLTLAVFLLVTGSWGDHSPPGSAVV